MHEGVGAATTPTHMPPLTCWLGRLSGLDIVAPQAVLRQHLAQEALDAPRARGHNCALEWVPPSEL